MKQVEPFDNIGRYPFKNVLNFVNSSLKIELRNHEQASNRSLKHSLSYLIMKQVEAFDKRFELLLT